MPSTVTLYLHFWYRISLFYLRLTTSARPAGGEWQGSSCPPFPMVQWPACTATSSGFSTRILGTKPGFSFLHSLKNGDEKNLKKANRMFTRVQVPHFSVPITRAGHSLLSLTWNASLTFASKLSNFYLAKIPQRRLATPIDSKDQFRRPWPLN